MRLLACLLALGLALGHQASAHEFWIAPEPYALEAPGQVVVHLREGEDFRGGGIAYHKRRFHRFDHLSPSGTRAIEGRDDDLPAAKLVIEEPGLHVLVHQTKLSLITYETLAKFERFLEGKRLDWGVEAHLARGLARSDIREAYFRYAKALIQYGDSEAGSDQSLGMPLELVALNNPYLGLDSLSVQLFRKQRPYADSWIFVLHKGSDGVEKTWAKTDERGIATIPLNSSGSYMINAVHLQEASARMNEVFGAEWQTLWASLTFKITR